MDATWIEKDKDLKREVEVKRAVASPLYSDSTLNWALNSIRTSSVIFPYLPMVMLSMVVQRLQTLTHTVVMLCTGNSSLTVGQAIFGYFLLSSIKLLIKHNHKQRRRHRISCSMIPTCSMVITITVLVVSLPTAAAAPLPTVLRFLRIGQPSSTVMAGSIGFTISCLQQGPPVDARLYWTLYAIWAFLAMCVISFTGFSVTPESRAKYFCLFVVIEIMCLAILVAASASAPDEIPKRLESWAPILTVLCASAPSLAFDSHIPKQKSDEESK